MTQQQASALRNWFQSQGVTSKQQKQILQEYCKVSGYQNPKHNQKNWRPNRVQQWQQAHTIETWPLFEMWWQVQVQALQGDAVQTSEAEQTQDQMGLLTPDTGG